MNTVNAMTLNEDILTAQNYFGVVISVISKGLQKHAVVMNYEKVIYFFLLGNLHFIRFPGEVLSVLFRCDGLFCHVILACMIWQ